MNLISIIVPVFNVEKYLGRCIASLLSQTYSNLELLLVDDGSTDGSRAIMESYAEKDCRIRCFSQPCNRGVSAARNLGLNEAKGDWIAFCDGDDWVHPQYLEIMLEMAVENQCDCVYCDYRIVHKKQDFPRISKNKIRVSFPDSRRSVAAGPISSCLHLIDRKLFESSNVSYPECCRQYEELPVIPTLHGRAEKIAALDTKLYYYFQRPDGSSASNLNQNVFTDFSAAYEILRQILGDGYREEVQYHLIYALHYGEILRMCKCRNISKKEICAKIRFFESLCPDYLRNPYLREMGKAKCFFLTMVSHRNIFLLRLLAQLHALIVH